MAMRLLLRMMLSSAYICGCKPNKIFVNSFRPNKKRNFQFRQTNDDRVSVIAAKAVQITMGDKSQQRRIRPNADRKQSDSAESVSYDEDSVNIRNGVTNKYISQNTAKCAQIFWVNNIDGLQRRNQLEIGCLQYFYLLEKYPVLNKFFKKDKIEETALRFFDMFGWLIRSLTLDGVNLWRVLTKVGEQHNRMKIRPTHYQYLLEAFR